MERIGLHFATDHALVCTELLWRSYRPGPEKEGLRIPLITVMGRKTLPANQIAALFAKERGKSSLNSSILWMAGKSRRRPLLQPKRHLSAAISEQSGMYSWNSKGSAPGLYGKN